MALPEGFDTQEFVRRVLAEDLGTGGDVTSNATIAADARFTAEMNCRQQIVVAGLDIATAFFRALDAAGASRAAGRRMAIAPNMARHCCASRATRARCSRPSAPR